MERSVMRTAQEPDALRFSRFREYLHALALASLDIIFFALFILDRLSIYREVHMPIRRVEAFLKDTDNPPESRSVLRGTNGAHRKDNQIGLFPLRNTTPAFAASSPAYHIPRMLQISSLVRANLAKLN